MSYLRVVLGLRREGRRRRAIGYDERPKMPDWIAALERRGIRRAATSAATRPWLFSKHTPGVEV